MKEIVTLVNEKDEVIGSKDRTLLLDTDRWRIVTIWLENSGGEVLLAQRSMAKKNNPGKWGPAAAGTVEYGETYDMTAKRELQEELGVDVPLQPVGVFMHHSMIGSRADMGFVGYTDQPAEAFTIQTEEVEQIKWVGKAALQANFAQNPGIYIQEFQEILNTFITRQ